MQPQDDTIAAIATPFGEGAIALLRLSGPRAVEIATAIFQGRRCPGEMASHGRQFGRVVDAGAVIDEVVLSVDRAPRSYTGEDVVEISCHGGILVTRRLLQLLLSRGARLAEPGEFTRRAFLNGKMDLTQAEAVMDLIKAQSALALRSATEQLEGLLGKKVGEIRELLLSLLAHVEAFIDFPDEDIDPATGEKLLAQLGDIRARIGALLDTADQGKVLREGVRTVICGEPNVGKSSLLNLLVGHDRAIVSEIPGTTRDTIEEVVSLRGIPLRLVDTAGLRESDDVIEREGIQRTRRQVERADLVLQIFDASQPPLNQTSGLALESFALPAPGMPATIVVLNKTDLGEHRGWQPVDAVRMSCKNGDGLARLGDVIFERLMHGHAGLGDSAVAINARHQACLESAARYCDAARDGLGAGVSAEFVAVDLRAALDAVGEIVGRADVEELLGKIFSTFCIGK